MTSNQEGAEMTKALAQELGIKPKVLEADIADLTWVWEESLREGKGVTPAHAIHILWALAKAYLRGHGIRMGNWQGIERHVWKVSKVKALILQRVGKENELGILYPKVHRLGLTSVKAAVDALINSAREGSGGFDILQEAQKILKEVDDGESSN